MHSNCIESYWRERTSVDFLSFQFQIPIDQKWNSTGLLTFLRGWRYLPECRIILSSVSLHHRLANGPDDSFESQNRASGYIRLSLETLTEYCFFRNFLNQRFCVWLQVIRYSWSFIAAECIADSGSQVGVFDSVRCHFSENAAPVFRIHAGMAR